MHAATIAAYLSQTRLLSWSRCHSQAVRSKAVAGTLAAGAETEILIPKILYDKGNEVTAAGAKILSGLHTPHLHLMDDPGARVVYVRGAGPIRPHEYYYSFCCRVDRMGEPEKHLGENRVDGALERDRERRQLR